jgi:hypothetical protein
VLRSSTAGLAALALSLAPVQARPDGDGSGDVFPLRSLDPGEPRPSGLAPRSNELRAALEEVGIVGSAWVLYSAKNFHAEPFPPPGPDSLLKKITGQAISFDANSISTNFVGHPLAGTGYYLAARGNRLPALTSGLYAAGAATAWELVEYRENMSVNDLLVTPLAGIAIGETLSQFGELSERAGIPALSWIVDFPRRFHDWIDGVPTQPAAGPAHHEVRLATSAGSLAAPGAGGALPVARVALAGSLLRARGYGEAGSGEVSLGDGGGASFLLEGTTSRAGAVDGRFQVRAILAGLYWRDLAEDAGGLSGHDLVVSLTAGYRADMHWYRGAPDRIDRLMVVEAPGLGLSWRPHLGGLRLDVRFDLAPAFGGITPAALQGWLASSPTPDALAAVTRLHGYAFAWGGAATAALGLRLGGLGLGGSARFDGLRALKAPDPDPVASPSSPSTVDLRLETRAWLSLDLPLRGLTLSAAWERRWREGHMDGAARRDGDEAVLGGLSWGF